MIGIDTNVLVRYMVQDDAKQAAKATKLIESLTVEQRGFVSLISMVELVWVFTASYGATREQVAAAIQTLLETKEIFVESSESVWKALHTFNAGKADFADCLIVQSCATNECEYVVTFDTKAAKFAGMKLLN